NTANFTTGGSIAVSIVDMTIFGGAAVGQPPLGGLVNPKNVAVAGLSNRSEGMIVVPHGNGKDYWLITHQNSSTNYSATWINKTSYTSGTFTTQVTGNLGLPISVANFSYNKKLKKLAVSAQDSKTDAIIVNFDNVTGAFTLDRTIFNTGTATTQPQSIYDIQWDNAGQYLYISRVGEAGIPADVLQYDYVNSTITTPPTTILNSVIKAPIFRSWGLQLAPDSAIYHIYQAVAGGAFVVEKFTKTDTVASSVIQTLLPFGALNFNGTQFPAFLPKSSSTLTLSFTTSTAPLCQNNNITFYPNVFPNADSLHWDFGDTTSVTDWSPVHKFKLNKTYSVTLTAYYQGKVQKVTQPVNISAFTLKLQLVTDTTACHCQLPVNKISCAMPQFSVTVKTTGGTPTFSWSNGQTGATLKPDSAGYYYVVATDGSGCSAYAGVNVKEYGKTDQRSNIWYFGNKAGIDFNKQPPKPLSTSAMDAPAGCAIMCDRNGQVIFYTDGDQVWDKTNTSIASGIGGNPGSTQSALIIPVPGDETLYYIFTTQAISNPSGAEELRYSLFDLKLNGGKGGVVQKDILLFARSTERLTGNNQWLVAHEYGNNTFRTYKITSQGISDPVYTAIGSVHSFQFAANGEGYMKLGPKNDLAVALSDPGTSNWVELFHLNDSTGVLSYYRKINLNHAAGQVYGIEFSPGGNKLFASVMDTPNSDIFEYSIDSIGKPHLKKDNVEPATIGALQLAPDSRIYFAVTGSTSLGVFTAEEDTTKITTGIVVNGFGLAAGTSSNLGLPNFRQQIGIGFGGPGFTFTGVCLGDTTKFVGTATDPIDKFQWFFGDGGSSTKAAPTHMYASAGTYTVFMRLTNRCGLDTTITKQVTIRPSPPLPTLSPATVICAAATVTLHANTPSTGTYTYLWSTGATTESIAISSPAVLSVTNTDATGCKATASGVVVDSRPKVALGPDLTVCQNNATPNLDAQNPGAIYAWTITNVTAGTSAPGGTIQFQTVDTSVPGIFKYSVTITDPITTCQTTAQKTFTVIKSPVFTMTGTNPSSCNATDGKISLTGITSPGLYTYLITSAGPPPFSQTNFDQSAATQGPFGWLPAGVYSGIITD
ncbi:MAG TPA: PKD domain-containing protein, partial [Cyclobacteriaceae bacterium]|nr:PKD domain-containing protein [Cyclobacteriaceae bacterium]